MTQTRIAKIWLSNLGKVSLSFLTIAFIWSQSAIAATDQRPEIKLRLMVEHSDNSRLESDPLGRDEFEINPALDITYSFNAPRVKTDIEYTIEQRHYPRDTQDDKSDILGTGSLLFTLADQNLFWNFYHNRSRLLISSNEANTRANQTERQLFNTGPSLRFNFDGDRSLNFNLSYIESSFSSGITNNSKQGRFDFRYEQPLTLKSALSVTGLYSDVTSDSANQNYKSSRLGLELNGSSRNSTYSISVGGNMIDRDLGLSFSAAYLSLSALFNTEAGDWNFGLNRELTDSSVGLGLTSNLLDDFSQRDSDFANTDVIERTRLEASYAKDIVPGRWAVNFNVFSDEQDYQTLLLDRQTIGARVTLKYFSTRRLRFEYRLSWAGRKIEDALNINDRSTDITHRIESWFNYNRMLNLSFFVGQNRRFFASHTRDHDEMVVGFTVVLNI
ncbi:MAG: hypothetical protein ACJAVI_004521 [Candidatus Azotimanducaceae bacterium]|jgi:hypothetical protein